MRSFFRNTPTAAPVESVEVQPTAPTAGVQTAPVEIALADGEVARFKVDLAMRVGDRILVAGWRHGEVEVGIRIDGFAPEFRTVATERGDVCEHFDIPKNQKPGFVMIAKVMGSGVPVLVCTSAQGEFFYSLDVNESDEVSEADAATLGSARPLLARLFPMFSKEWRRALGVASTQPTQAARGYLEGAVWAGSTAHAVVYGWVAAEPCSQVWIEDDSGKAYTLDGASWRARPDVFQAIGADLGAAAMQSGFVLHIQPTGPITRIKLKALTSEGVHVLADIACSRQSAEPVDFSRWLFGIGVPDGMLTEHTESVDAPILDALIARARAVQADLPVVSRQLGQVQRQPRVSIIVPLYGRTDFVESQMLEWARDPWVQEHAELIYVIDDPALADAFRVHAEELYRLYAVPFRWIWGSANRGYSAANNLGAGIANGEYLLFLNSDVFPQQPGWLSEMVQVLDKRADIGALAPRLTFAEGGIQHAGMRFSWLADFDVWINQHPNIGLDTALDPAKELTIVPAVTGACLLVRRTDFDAVGGWDTGYLIGDFEDSDLCLKLRSAGLSIGYLPQVQLTHLERQSMTAIGSGDYRMRVTLWNALRHQRRWRSLIEAPVEAHA